EAIQSNELAFRRDLDLVFMFVFEIRKAALDAVLENVGYGPQPGGTVRRKRLRCGSGPSSAAADERDFDGVVLARKARANDGGSQRRRGDGSGGGPQEFAAASEAGGVGIF